MTHQAKLYIGTSGWSYPKGDGKWTGYFYPTGKINELGYYSQFFNTVEINSTFYRPANPRYVCNWVRRTPKEFLFTVKLWQKFTHPKMYKEANGEDAEVSQRDVALFNRGIEPLVKSGKLGALLAQFPSSFQNKGHEKQTLDTVIKTFGKYGLAIELRHRSWSDDENIAQMFKDNNVTWVQIDEPKFKSSVAVELPTTSDTVYFRFHGRNTKTWWTGNNETRYKYLYSAEEIDELAVKVKSVMRQAKLLFVMFNNHWRGYAPRNAVEIMKSLQVLPVE